MRDPHVVELRYNLKTQETITFDDPPAIVRETEAFHVRVANGSVTFRMKNHHATEESAKEEAENYLRAYEIFTALQYGYQVYFEYRDAQIIDRNPVSPDEPHAKIVGLSALTARAHVPTLRERRPAYPDPPTAFVVSEEVDAMWENYNDYLEGRYPLLPLAYSCYTLLRYTLDTRKNAVAAKKLCVSTKVLEELRKRSSYLGTKRSARKWDIKTNPRPPTHEEERWFEGVLKALIKRLGEYVAEPEGEWPKITLDNFPTLPKL